MRLTRTQQRQLTYDGLGTIMGIARTTTYRWVHELEHESILGLFACLERLSVTELHQAEEPRSKNVKKNSRQCWETAPQLAARCQVSIRSTLYMAEDGILP